MTVLYPNPKSIFRVLGIISLILFLVWITLSINSVFLNNSLLLDKLFVSFAIFFGLIIFILLIFLSFKITITNTNITFFQFFIPVKKIHFSDVSAITHEKISMSGQVDALTITYSGGIYSFPIRLFSADQLNRLLEDMKTYIPNIVLVNENSTLLSTIKEKKNSVRRTIKHILILIVMIIIALYFKKMM